MSEKRKPCISILLKSFGKNKTSIVEVFEACLWPEQLEKFIKENNKDKTAKRYRIRVNRKWHSSKSQKFMFFTEFEIRNIFSFSLKQIF